MVGITRELERGTLVTLFDSRVTAPARYLLVRSPASMGKPQVQAFRDWVLGQAGCRSSPTTRPGNLPAESGRGRRQATRRGHDLGCTRQRLIDLGRVELIDQAGERIQFTNSRIVNL